jgi:hypothetical protein
VSDKPAKPSVPSKPKKSAGLIGVGLDNDDGHKRITTGEKFVLVGGSAETHDRMTETVVRTFEELKQRKKQLETVTPDEFKEILHKVTPR